MSTLTATSESPATSSVGALPPALSTYIDAQISAIREGDAALRRGEDPIHPTRVALRRLRSTLRVFRDAFDPEFAARLDEELSWYAGVLGHVRDHEVQRERFARAVAELPTEWVIGPVAADIDATLGAEQRVYRANVDVVLAGDRYAALLGAVDEIARRGRTVKKKRVVELAKKAATKARRRLSDASTHTDDDEALHSARKAFKRARYAAELIEPVVGSTRSKKAISQFKEAQEVLGEHQDSLVAATFLRRLGSAAGARSGENGFTYGLLFAREQNAAAAAEQKARSLQL